MLEVVGSSAAGDDSFTGTKMEAVFPYTAFLGRQSIERVGAELVMLGAFDAERLCQISDKVIRQGELGLPADPDAIFIWQDIVKRYSGKILLANIDSGKQACPSGNGLRVEHWCKQFPETTVIVDRPSYLYAISNHDGTFYKNYQNCEVLNHDDSFSTIYSGLLEHLETTNVTLYANLETIEHPWRTTYSSLLARLFMSWMPALFSLVLLQYAARALLYRARRTGSQNQDLFVLLPLLLNCIVLSALAAYFMIDEGSINIDTPLSWTTQNFFRQGFSLTRIGINLCILARFTGLKQGLEGAAYATTSAPKTILIPVLKVGFLLFAAAEIPVSILLLSRKTSGRFIYIVPVILVLAEIVVSACFVVTGYKAMRKIQEASPASHSRPLQKALRLFSVVVFASGINSLLNIIWMAFAGINFNQTVSSATFYSMVFGALAYFRLIDAMLQIIVLSPVKLAFVPKVSLSCSTTKTTRVRPQEIGDHVKQPKVENQDVETLDSRWQTALD